MSGRKIAKTVSCLTIRIVNAAAYGRKFRTASFTQEYLDDPHPGDILVEKGVKMRDPRTDEAIGGARLGAEHDGDDGQEGKGSRDRERKFDISEKHHATMPNMMSRSWKSATATVLNISFSVSMSFDTRLTSLPTGLWSK